MTLESQKAMHLMVLELISSTDKRKTLLELLVSAKERTQAKSGCLSCVVYLAFDTENTILYLEYWRSKKEMIRHIQSNLYRQILVAMEFATKEPTIGFLEVSKSAGIELIERQRALTAYE